MEDNGDKPSTETITLEDGRVVRLRQPRASDEFTAMQLASEVAALVRVFEPLMCVLAINNEAEPNPNTRAKMDKLADRLGKQGINGVVEWHARKVYPEFIQALEELGPTADVGDLNKRMGELRVQKIKNSPTTLPSGRS